MAKFALNDTTVFSIGGNALTCAIDLSLDDSVDDIVSECFGSTDFKVHILAGRTVSGSFSQEIEDDDVTQLTYTVPKVSGALILQPAGPTVGDIEITSTNMQITSRSFAYSRSGLFINTVNFVLDDLTIAAISA